MAELPLISTRRASSIRTRIKTSTILACIGSSAWTRRASSIRTRIKTPPGMSVRHLIMHLAEHLPLEQGLRLARHGTIVVSAHSRRASSIRTRIKTFPGQLLPGIGRSSRIASSIRTRMLRREVGTNNKRRLLCQQAPLVVIYVLL